MTQMPHDIKNEILQISIQTMRITRNVLLSNRSLFFNDLNINSFINITGSRENNDKNVLDESPAEITNNDTSADISNATLEDRCAGRCSICETNKNKNYCSHSVLIAFVLLLRAVVHFQSFHHTKKGLACLSTLKKLF